MAALSSSSDGLPASSPSGGDQLPAPAPGLLSCWEDSPSFLAGIGDDFLAGMQSLDRHVVQQPAPEAMIIQACLLSLGLCGEWSIHNICSNAFAFLQFLFDLLYLLVCICWFLGSVHAAIPPAIYFLVHQ